MSEDEKALKILSRMRYAWLGGCALGVAGTVANAVAEHTLRGAPIFAFIAAVFFAGHQRWSGYLDGHKDGHVAANRQAEARRGYEFSLDPGPTPAGEGYVYILKFSTGVIKVGQTLDPVRRFREHRRDAEAYGAAIVEYWLSQPHVNYLDNEVDLIVWCDEAATWRSKREYFQGLDLADVRGFASGLTYYSATARDTEDVES